ncbi:hypothetical protein FO519_006750 [Halicephalobus sp. NKZ332]|nr:hypothetical protein FO519_006750 [Halicephalobus sp. NKZ332]
MGFDERQFAKAVQKRQAKKAKLAKEKENMSSGGSIFKKREKTSTKEKVVVCEDPNNNDFLDALRSDMKKKETAESTMKKRLLGKIFKILQLKESSKNKTAEEKRKVYRRRSRSSQSSTPSNFEPMPTIYEEDGEEDTISIASYEIEKQPIIAVA